MTDNCIYQAFSQGKCIWSPTQKMCVYILATPLGMQLLVPRPGIVDPAFGVLTTGLPGKSPTSVNEVSSCPRPQQAPVIQGSKAGSGPPSGSTKTHRVASERMRLISCAPHGCWCWSSRQHLLTSPSIALHPCQEACDYNAYFTDEEAEVQRGAGTTT